MSVRVFLDTNVLVYAYDKGTPGKQRRAQALLEAAIAEGGVISSQVLGEFHVVVTRKLPEPLTPSESLEIVTILSALETVPVDAGLVREAIQLQEKSQVAYWDALILAAANRAGCTVVYSEDLSTGQTYGCAKVVNPFAGD